MESVSINGDMDRLKRMEEDKRKATKRVSVESTICKKKEEKMESNGGNVNEDKKRTDRKRNRNRREIRRDNEWEGKEKRGEMEDNRCLCKWKYRRDIAEDRTVAGGKSLSPLRSLSVLFLYLSRYKD